MFISTLAPALVICAAIASAAPSAQNEASCFITSQTCGGGPQGNDWLCGTYCHRIRGVGGTCKKDPNCWDWLDKWVCHCDGALAISSATIESPPPDLVNGKDTNIVPSTDESKEPIGARHTEVEENNKLQKRLVCGWPWSAALCEIECQKQGCSRGGHCDNQNICRSNCD